MSERYMLWHEAAQWRLSDGGKKLWAFPVKVEAVCSGVRMNADVDNLLKSILDALTGTVLKDDRQVMEATIRKTKGELFTTIDVQELR